MADQVADVMAALRREIAAATVDVTLEITANLIEATPVDTGFARASWVPSVGTPSDAQPTETDVGSAASAQADGQAAVLAFTYDQGQTFVTNNTEYIEALAAGSSDQAPSGFVDAAVEQAVQTVQQRHASVTVKL